MEGNGNLRRETRKPSEGKRNYIIYFLCNTCFAEVALLRSGRNRREGRASPAVGAEEPLEREELAVSAHARVFNPDKVSLLLLLAVSIKGVSSASRPALPLLN